MKTTSSTALKDMTQPSSGLIPFNGGTESEVFTGHAIFRDNPFDGLAGNYRVIEFIEGSTADQLVNLVCIDNSWIKNYIAVKVGDQIIPRESWHLVKLKRTAPIQLLVVAQGGGGNILKQVAMIAVIVAVGIATSGAGFAAFTGLAVGSTALAVASALTVMAVSMVAGLALNAVFPPPSSDMPALGSSSSGSGLNESDKFTWNVDTNTNNQYKPVPRIYGRVKVAPPYAARPYIEAIGDKQYMYLLYDFGYGPLQLEDLRIGENAIQDYESLQYRIYPSFKKGNSLEFYNRDVYQESFSMKLEKDVWRNANGAQNSSEFVLDFGFPQGLCRIDSTTGDVNQYQVDIAVLWRVAGTSNWIPFSQANHSIVGNGTEISADASMSNYWSSTSGEYEASAGSEPYYDENGNYIEGVPARVPDYEVFDSPPTPSNYPQGYNITIRKTEILQGRRGTYTVVTYCNYQRTSSTAPLETKIRVDNKTQKPFTTSLVMRMDVGDYEFCASRYSPDSNDRYISDDVYLSSIKSIKNVTPIAPEAPHTIVEIKILANDQLNGVVNNFSAVATSILPVWNGSGFVEVPTRNPAWAYLDVLRGTASVRPASLDRIDIASFADWAQWCDKPAINAPSIPKSQCDLVVSGEYTSWQVLKMISATGDATPSVRSGKYSISIDRPKDYPVQLFTPRNSADFSANLTYTKVPHALRVSFIDPENNWQGREAIVYDDGYDESNATEFQTMDLVGITRYEQAYRIGRRSIAQAKLRRETFSITTGVENVLATRGDLVRLSYDIPKIGVGWARISKVAGNIITFDDELQLIMANDYLRVRISDSYQADLLVLNVIDLYTIAVSGDVPVLRAGQLAVFGSRQKITMDCLVKSISPSADLSASLELVPYAEGIYSAEGKPIPAYDPLISTLGDRRVGKVVGLQVGQIDTVINRYHYVSITLSWRPPIGVMPVGYDIYELQDFDWVQIGTTKKTTYFAYKDVKAVKDDGSKVEIVGKRLTFAVVGVGPYASRLSPSQSSQASIKPVGDLVRPLEPDYFDLDIRSKETIYLEWSKSQSNDMAYYIVRYSPLFKGANFDKATIVAGKVPWNSTSITVPARLGTYFVKSVDTSGNVSSLAARAVTPTETLNDDISLIRLEESTWTGTLINMEHYGSTAIQSQTQSFTTLDPIKPNQDGDFPFVLESNLVDEIPRDSNGDFPFYEASAEYDPIELNNGELPFYRYDEIYSQGGAYVYEQVINLGEIYPTVFSASIEAYALKDGNALEPQDVAGQWDAWFEIRTSDSIPYIKEWPPMEGVVPNLLYGMSGWTPWRKFYAGEYTGQYFQLRVCVASNDKEIGVRVTRAYVDVSARVRLEGEYDVICPVDGVDVVFDPPYKLQPAIAITQDNSKDGDRFSISNKSRLGFRINFFDKQGTPVQRQFDWISKGHGKEVFELPPYDQKPAPKESLSDVLDSPYMSSIQNDTLSRGYQ